MKAPHRPYKLCVKSRARVTGWRYRRRHGEEVDRDAGRGASSQRGGPVTLPRSCAFEREPDSVRTVPGPGPAQ